MSTATDGVGSYPGSRVSPDNYGCCRFRLAVTIDDCSFFAAGVG